MATTIWPSQGAGNSGTQVTGGVRHTAKPISLNLTDKEQVRLALAAILENDEAAAAVSEMMHEKLRSLGVAGKIDRKYAALPESVHATAGHDVELTSEMVFGRSAAMTPLARGLNQWFRAVLFGRTPESEIVKRALSEGVDSEGGHVVPPGFIAEVIRDAPKLSNLYQYFRQIPVPNNGGEIPKVATNAGVSWGTENEAFAENDPALGNSTYAIRRMNVLVKMSRELANDSNPSIVELISSLFREKIVEERDRVGAVGNASLNEPVGIYSAAGIADDNAVTTLNYDSLVDLHESVDERYFGRSTTRWVMNQRVKAAIMKIKDDENRPIFQVDPSNGFKATILGHPVSIETALPNSFIFFGDLSYYLVFNRETLGVESSTEAGTAFATHQRWIKFWERWDGKPVLPPKNPMARRRQLAGIS